MARLHLIRETDLHNCYWGISTSLWFNGCPHRCVGCWNEETWEINNDLFIDNREVISRTLKALDNPIRKDLTLLGGEPLMPKANLDDVIEIVSEIKRVRPSTRVLCWTGFKMEYLMKHKQFVEALKLIDILIDGRFEQELRVHNKKYGSSNQRIIDVKETLATGEIVIAPENYKKGEC